MGNVILSNISRMKSAPRWIRKLLMEYVLILQLIISMMIKINKHNDYSNDNNNGNNNNNNSNNNNNNKNRTYTSQAAVGF